MKFDELQMKKIEEIVKNFHPHQQGFQQPNFLDDPFINEGDLLPLAKQIFFYEPERIISSRPVIGPLIVFSKKTILAICRPFLKILFHKQVQFNYVMWLLSYKVVLMNKKIIQLEAELKRLSDK